MYGQEASKQYCISSRHFKDSVDDEGIVLLEAPVESPSTISNIQRYHVPLRTSYCKIGETHLV